MAPWRTAGPRQDDDPEPTWDYAVRDGIVYRSRRRNITISALAITLGGALILAVGQGVLVRSSVESTLETTTHQALANAGFPEVTVTVEGRDVILGSVPGQDATKVTQIVQQVPGVYRVSHESLATPLPGSPSAGNSNQAVPGTSASSSATEPTASPGTDPGTAVGELAGVAATVDSGTVSLYGAVPTRAARTALVEALAETFGADAVQSQLSIRSSAGGIGLEQFPAVVTALGTATRAAVVSLRAGQLTVTGTTASDVNEAVRAAGANIAGSQPGQMKLDLATAPTAGTEPATGQEVARMLSAFPSITFAPASARIRPESERVVAAEAELLIAHPDVSAQVQGYTDATGNPDTNLTLSTDRASAVRSALVDAGVEPQRVTAQGYGSTKPVAEGSSELANELNRRVVLVAAVS